MSSEIHYFRQKFRLILSKIDEKKNETINKNINSVLNLYVLKRFKKSIHCHFFNINYFYCVFYFILFL